MNLEQVKNVLQPYLEEHGLTLYDMAFKKESGYLILQVLIDKENGIDIEELAACNEFLSLKLDQLDSDMGEYMLEVSSPGAEKELRNLEEIKKHLHNYIHIEVEQMIYEGTLEEVQDQDIFIRVNAKGRFKTLKIAYDDIRFIRLAVKI